MAFQFSSDIRRKKREGEIRQRAIGTSSSRLREGRSPVVRSLVFSGAERGRPSTSTASFYGHASRDRDDYWWPGETIPNFVPESPDPLATSTPHHSTVNPPDNAVMDTLQYFQASMEKQLTAVCSKLSNIDEQMDNLEGRQISLEDEVKASTSLSSSSVCTPEPRPRVRRRVTPTSLQSKIRHVHSSLEEDNQLKPSEAINSRHNSKVVDEIIRAIGCEKYTEDMIRRGCRTYRKTLVERSKHTATPVKKKKQERSRKQRSYERRGKVVKEGRET